VKANIPLYTFVPACPTCKMPLSLDYMCLKFSTPLLFFGFNVDEAWLTRTSGRACNVHGGPARLKKASETPVEFWVDRLGRHGPEHDYAEHCDHAKFTIRCYGEVSLAAPMGVLSLTIPKLHSGLGRLQRSCRQFRRITRLKGLFDVSAPTSNSSGNNTNLGGWASRTSSEPIPWRSSS